MGAVEDSDSLRVFSEGVVGRTDTLVFHHKTSSHPAESHSTTSPHPSIPIPSFTISPSLRVASPPTVHLHPLPARPLQFLLPDNPPPELHSQIA